MLDQIQFSYPETTIPVLNKVSVTIKENTTVAFVGATGSGKTTLIDIILGLLTAQGGALLVDGTPITSDNERNWQQTIGYVPQDIFLSDDTVERNIAFGLDEKEIDHERVATAAKIAALDEFITTDMKDGYNTIIGERGIRLSGGQRQRIGLARALYDNPPVLVLDEATSSLDGITETEVMEAIKSASKDRTVIIIAHRLSTVQNCDVIYLMEKGSIIAEGTYDELLHQRHLPQDGEAVIHWFLWEGVLSLALSFTEGTPRRFDWGGASPWEPLLHRRCNGATGIASTRCVDPIPRQETHNDPSTRNTVVKAIRRLLFMLFLLMEGCSSSINCTAEYDCTNLYDTTQEKISIGHDDQMNGATVWIRLRVQKITYFPPKTGGIGCSAYTTDPASVPPV